MAERRSAPRPEPRPKPQPEPSKIVYGKYKVFSSVNMPEYLRTIGVSEVIAQAFPNGSPQHFIEFVEEPGQIVRLTDLQGKVLRFHPNKTTETAFPGGIVSYTTTGKPSSGALDLVVKSTVTGKQIIQYMFLSEGSSRLVVDMQVHVAYDRYHSSFRHCKATIVYEKIA